MSSLTGFGITPEGYVIPLLSDIQGEIEQSLKAAFGANINLEPSAFFGQITGIFSERELKVWQAGQDVYLSQNPDEAFGASLDNVGALRGIPRFNAAPSVVQNVRLFGTVGTIIPVGTQFSVLNSPLNVFQLLNPVTLAAGQSCVQMISFSSVPVAGTWQLALGGSETALLPFNANAAQVQTAIRTMDYASGCIVTGDYTAGFTVTFAGEGTGGLMVQPLFVIRENALTNSVPAAVTITPTIVTPGVDQATVSLTAVADGPTIANAGTLTVIVTPVSGLDAVLNTQDALVGQDVESDNAYRARMATQLQVAGAGTVEAIRARLREIQGVTAALVFENISDIPDLAGRPGRSFECVVQGGDIATIAETIWLAKPAGIPTFGNTFFDIIDSQGQTHRIYFSRPTAIPVYIIANLTIDDTYPSNGDTTVAQALVNYGNSLGIGAELIVVPKLVASIALIQGIQDAVLLVGTSPGPTLPDNITPPAFGILEFDTGRVQVNHT